MFGREIISPIKPFQTCLATEEAHKPDATSRLIVRLIGSPSVLC